MFLIRKNVSRTSVIRSAARQQSALRPLHTFPEQRCAATSVTWENEHTVSLMFRRLLLCFHMVFIRSSYLFVLHPTPKSECALNFDRKHQRGTCWPRVGHWSNTTGSSGEQGWPWIWLHRLHHQKNTQEKGKKSHPEKQQYRKRVNDVYKFTWIYTNLPMKMYQIFAWMSSTSVVGPASGP